MRVLSTAWARLTVAAVVLAGAATTALTAIGVNHDVRAVSAVRSGWIAAIEAGTAVSHAPSWSPAELYVAAEVAALSRLDHGSIRPAGAVTGDWVDHGSAYRIVVVRHSASLTVV